MKYLILLLIWGCASNSKKYPKIKNTDFKKSSNFKIQKISYETKEDIKGLLANETIHNLYTDIDIDAKNIVSGILLNCYQKDFDKAYEFSKKYYVDYSKNVSYWNVVGICHLLEKKYLKAALFFNKGLEVNKKFAPIYNNKAVLKSKLGQDDAALALLKKSIRYSKKSLTPKYNLAMLYLKYSVIPKAKDILVYLYKKSPKDKDVLNGLATISTIEGNHKQALKVYSNINSKLFEDANFGLGYGVSLYHAARPKAALDILEDIDKGTKPQIRMKKALIKRWSK